ncbi:MAG TPA: redox-sensitive transcriptional activator SoxR [Acidimicrobiaceae bacterium]|nr:redox-sensitive transcriptional activator SoxR [Acidimicrobiaceae bacterium]
MELTLSIGEVAERSGMATSALRFYEDQGLISSERTSGGHRLYNRAVLRRLAFIRVAQRVGLSLADISAALGELPAGRTPTKDDWERLSRRWRGHLDERITLLERLRDQLTSCIGCGCLSLRTCALSNPEDAAGALGSGPRYLLGDSSKDAVAYLTRAKG